MDKIVPRKKPIVNIKSLQEAIAKEESAGNTRAAKLLKIALRCLINREKRK